MFERVSLLLAVLLLAAPALAQQPIAGTWSGQVLEVEPDGETEIYPVEVRFNDTGGGTIRYSSLDCGGTLTPLRTVGGVREFREKLTYGLDNCVDGGTVGVWPKGDKLMWYWTGEGTSDPDIVASAVLSRGPATSGERR